MFQKYLLWTLLALCFSSVACTKDELTFGNDFLNKSDFVRAFIDSSTTVTTSTQLDAKLRSTDIVYMVGKASVSGFAESEASFMTRFFFKDLAVNFRDNNVKLDSIVLRLVPKSRFLGDSIPAQTFKIYELTQPITKEIVAAYFDEGKRPDNLINGARLLDSKTFIAKPSDSLADFRYRFTDEQAQNLFNRFRESYRQDTSLFYNDSVLNSVFKGLYIKPEVGSAIMDYAVEIEIRTHKGTEKHTSLLKPTVDAYNNTTLADERRNLYVQALTIFDHEYDEIQTHLDMPSEISYVSGFMGLKTQLKFNDFDNWKDSLVVFNMVTVSVPIEQINPEDLAPEMPMGLQLRIYDAEQKEVAIINSAPIDSAMTNFNLTPFMPILRRNSTLASDYTYEIVVPYNNVYGNAFKIDAAENKIKVEIRYSR